MRKLVASLIVMVMLVSLTACGNKIVQDAEPIKESIVAESDSASSVTEENGIKTEEAGSVNTEAEKNAENTVEDAAADSETGEAAAVDNESTPAETVGSTEHMEDSTMKITAGDTTFTATLADNSSVEALKELLAEGPLTINMSDYAGLEKVGSIGTDLPRNDEQISTGTGDIILYQGSSLVIYYDTNSWDFTRIGKIEGVSGEELLEAFGDGDVTVTFSLE